MSRPPNSRTYFTSCIAAVALAGCALTSKADALNVRYFDMEVPANAAGATTAAMATKEVRIGRISAASHLRDRRVSRKSDSEIDFDEQKRWTERPDSFLRRALAHAFFEEQGMKQSVSGLAPVFDCELLHFEEIVEGGRTTKVRVGIVYALHDERSVLVGERFTVVVPVEGTGDPGVVHAYEKALRQVVNRVVTTIGPSAVKPPTDTPPPPAH